jgi:hypothetical protein
MDYHLKSPSQFEIFTTFTIEIQFPAPSMPGIIPLKSGIAYK